MTKKTTKPPYPIFATNMLENNFTFEVIVDNGTYTYLNNLKALNMDIVMDYEAKEEGKVIIKGRARNRTDVEVGNWDYDPNIKA